MFPCSGKKTHYTQRLLSHGCKECNILNTIFDGSSSMTTLDSTNTMNILLHYHHLNAS